MGVEQLGGLSEQAAREILRRRIIAEYWRGMRRRASLLLALLIPLLAGLLAAAFPFLTRAHVTGSRSVFTVCLLGGLLAGTLLAAPKLAELIRTRAPSEEQLADKLLLFTLVPALLSGLVGGLGAAFSVLAYAARDSYKPQTLYVIAFALASALFPYCSVHLSVVSAPIRGRG
jgi:MFS family permease